MRSRQSALDTLAGVRRSRGLPAHPASLPEWSFRVAGLRITLPNFSWRRGAIDKHDLHHLVLDEPFNLKGECQVATWEFAAGAYPDVRARRGDGADADLAVLCVGAAQRQPVPDGA